MARHGGALNPTPADRLVDSQNRPYFLWDQAMDLDGFKLRLEDPDPEVRAYFLAKLMRPARPDDVFQFVTARQIAESWTAIQRHLGQSLAFWDWLLGAWEKLGLVKR